MEAEESIRICIDEALQSDRRSARKRLRCSFPIFIKGINILGDCYEKAALTENVGGRGICIRAYEAVIPGSIFLIYATEEKIDPLAIFEVIWVKDMRIKGMLIGARLLGDNRPWLRYLIRDVFFNRKA